MSIDAVKVMDYDGTIYVSTIPKGITFDKVWKAMNNLLSNKHSMNNKCTFVLKDKK